MIRTLSNSNSPPRQTRLNKNRELISIDLYRNQNLITAHNYKDLDTRNEDLEDVKEYCHEITKYSQDGGMMQNSRNGYNNSYDDDPLNMIGTQDSQVTMD